MGWLPEGLINRIKSIRITDTRNPSVTYGGCEYENVIDSLAIMDKLKKEFALRPIENPNKDKNPKVTISSETANDTMKDIDRIIGMSRSKSTTTSKSEWYSLQDSNGKSVLIRYIKEQPKVRVLPQTTETGHPAKQNQGFVNTASSADSLPKGPTITFRFDDGFDETLKQKLMNTALTGNSKMPLSTVPPNTPVTVDKNIINYTPSIVPSGTKQLGEKDVQSQQQQQRVEPTQVGMVGQQQQMG